MRILAPTCALLTLALSSCSGDENTAVQNEPTSSAQESNTAVDMHLVQEPGFELVLRHCVTCHGPRQFLQQRGDRATWLGLIRWMQSDHGMQPLPEGAEDRIVDYLATHYGPEHSGRRKPLRAELMPPKRYQ
ncbi:MAG: mono/diheme cytochrome c family protein [Planctomycetota bacterium]|jgi:mono/diheme cytochrome c family protein